MARGGDTHSVKGAIRKKGQVAGRLVSGASLPNHVAVTHSPPLAINPTAGHANTSVSIHGLIQELYHTCA